MKIYIKIGLCKIIIGSNRGILIIAAMMIFGALGWMIAGGTLGPLPAFVLAAIAGLLRAPFDTHTIFTSIEFGLLAMLFSMAIRQRYRTTSYKEGDSDNNIP